MEYAAGGDLFKRIRSSKGIQVPVNSITWSACSGVATVYDSWDESALLEIFLGQMPDRPCSRSNMLYLVMKSCEK